MSNLPTLRRGRPALERGVLGDITVTEQVTDGKLANGNTHWRAARPDDAADMPRRWQARAMYRDKKGNRRKLAKFSTKSGNNAKTLLRNAWNDFATREKLIRPELRTPVATLANDWWAEFSASDTVRPQTLDGYRHYFEKCLIPEFGSLTVGELDTKTIYDGLQSLAEGAISNARMTRVLVKHLCTYAVRLGLMVSNPVTAEIPSYKGRGEPVRHVSTTEYKDIRQAVTAWQNAPHYGPPRGGNLLDILDFIVGVGCRPGEALAVRWKDVDIEAGRVTIAGTLVKARKGHPVHRQDWTKTAAGFRSVQLPRATIAMLMRRAGTPVPGSLPMGAEPGTGLVFPNATGGYLDPNNFRRQLRQALKAADMEGFVPKLLRKTASSEIRDKAGIEAASAVLGHSSTAVTAKYYAGAVHDAPDVAHVMDEFLSSAGI